MSRSLNDLFDYVPLKIYQNDDFFKFSLDSVLLAEFVKNIKFKKNIIDLCAGNCAVSMILSTKFDGKVIAVELQDKIYKLAKESVSYNNLDDRISVINADIKDVGKYFPGNNVDTIVCNPPYFVKNDTSYINRDNIKAIARHEITVNLEDVIKVSSQILNLNGELYLVHRPERFDEIVHLCIKYAIPVKDVQFITTKDGEKPKLVLVRAVRGGKLGLKIYPYICIENLTSFKNIFWKE